MLKKTVTYEDFNGNEVTEDLFFHLSKAELIELELSREGGFSERLKKVIEAEDGKAIIEEFKTILMMAYGQKSEDGKRFIKNQTLRDEFESSEAYSTLFMSLVTDADAAARFVNGIVPSGLVEEAAEITNGGQDYEFKPLTPVPSEPKVLTKAEIAAMSDEEFRRLGSDLTLGKIRISED